MSKPLSVIQRKFVEEYVTNGFNAKGAAITVGYAETTAKARAWRFLNHPKIKEIVESVKGNLDATSVKDAIAPYAWKAGILKRLVSAVIPDDETQPINLEYGKIAIAAIAELNKMSGEYAPQKRLQLTVDMTKDRIIEAKKEYQEF